MAAKRMGSRRCIRIDIDRAQLLALVTLLVIGFATLVFVVDSSADRAEDAIRQSTQNAELIKAVQFNSGYLRCIALVPQPRTAADDARCEGRARAAVERTERMAERVAVERTERMAERVAGGS